MEAEQEEFEGLTFGELAQHEVSSAAGYELVKFDHTRIIPIAERHYDCK
jgi:hypothetical protein